MYKLINGKYVSFSDNKIFLNEDEVYAGINCVEKAHSCYAGNICCLVDDGGILMTVIFTWF